MQLSPHFSDREFGLIGCEQRLIDNAIFMCVNILEPIRAHFGPVNLHDAYRDPAHNARVGGKPTSFHMFVGGKSAADIDVSGFTYKQVFDWIRLQSKLPFDKVILESNAAGHPSTIHLQVDRNAPPRRQAFLGGTGDSQRYTLVQTV